MYTLRRLLIGIVNIFLGIVSFFLVLRIAFELIPVNSTTPFVSWVYRISEAFVYPFRGIVPNSATGSGGTLDWVAIVAWLIYLVLGALVVSILDHLIPASTIHEDYVEQEPATYHTVRRRRRVISD